MHVPLVIAVLVAAFGLIAATGTAVADPPGGPHTPVTICHKPGTPAEHTLVVDDDAVPGHLGHGDSPRPVRGHTATNSSTWRHPTRPGGPRRRSGCSWRASRGRSGTGRRRASNHRLAPGKTTTK